MKKILKPLRPALSMVELVFVIAVLGIVASIGAEIVVQVYESYLVQRATYRSSIKTELAATQIVNRLSSSIPNTIIARVSNANPSYVPLDHLDNANYMVLQWIGADDDSFGSIASDTNRKPGWSGLCDVDASSANSIVTPGSNLTVSSNVINNLSLASISDAALFFSTVSHAGNIGYNGNTSGVGRIQNINTATYPHSFTLDNNMTQISELYKLAWSSYAIVPVQRNGGDCTDPTTQQCDLELRYDFRPWEGDRYNDSNDYLRKTLLRNVTVFRFTGSGNTIRFKICQEEKIGGNLNITTCKEKAVIR